MTVDRIEVYCQEASHAEKRWRIGTFEHIEGSDQWHLDDHDARSGQKQTLIGNRRLPRVLMGSAAEVDTGGARDRYPLECRRCTLSLPITEGSAAMSKLQSMLDNLAAAGVSEISLSALVARFT